MNHPAGSGAVSAVPAWLRVAPSSGHPGAQAQRGEGAAGLALVLPPAVLGRMGPSSHRALLRGLPAPAGGRRGQAALRWLSRVPRGGASPGQGGHPRAEGTASARGGHRL